MKIKHAPHFSLLLCIIIVIVFLAIIAILANISENRSSSSGGRKQTAEERFSSAVSPDIVLAHGGSLPGRAVGIVTMMRDQRDVAYWLNYHLRKGISHFYIRLETLNRDQDSNAKLLLSYPQVTLQIGDPNKTPSADDIDEPGQRQMLRQRAWAAEAVEYAFRDGIDWLVHIDSDELLECTGGIGDAIAKDALPDTHTMVMSNIEAVYDESNISQDSGNSCFRYKSVRDCNQGLCAAYANGKAVGRVTPFLREFGVHRFRYVGPGQDKEVHMTSLRVLHFESCNFMQYVGKFLRLSASEKRDFPFPYYNESIVVARGPECKAAALHPKDPLPPTCKDAFASVYRKYRIA